MATDDVDAVASWTIYNISNDHDLQICIHQKTHGPDDRRPGHRSTYLVHRATLELFPELARLLSRNMKADHSKITLEDDESPSALDIWFRICHDQQPSDVSLRIVDVWRVISTAHKYHLDLTQDRARQWFKDWWKTNQKGKTHTIAEASLLLYPCYMFDHAQAFLELTKMLVYDARGVLYRAKPYGYNTPQWNLKYNIINAINVARVETQQQLHTALYEPIVALLTANNVLEHEENKTVLWKYEKALLQTQAWPMKEKLQHLSTNKLLQKLRTFDALACPELCQSIVAAVNSARDVFDGLCLDCMQNSAMRDEVGRQWKEAHLATDKWNTSCRVKHSQSTWMHSFSGSVHERNKLLKQKLQALKQNKEQQYEELTEVDVADNARRQTKQKHSEKKSRRRLRLHNDENEDLLLL